MSVQPSIQNIQRAFAKASLFPCYVEPLSGRYYAVNTPDNHEYVCHFWTGEDGLRYGLCNCIAGSQPEPLACYHLICAAYKDSELTGTPMRDFSDERQAA